MFALSLKCRLGAAVVFSALLLSSLSPAFASASNGPAPHVVVDTTNIPHPPDDNDRECAESVAGCVVGAVLYTVFAPAFNALFSDARIAGAGGPASALSLRAGRTIRYDSGTSAAFYPYAALGIRSQQVTPTTPQPHNEKIFLEGAVGMRSPLHTWTPSGADWLKRVHLSTEVRWLHNGDVHDQLWIEVAPGLATARPASPSRLVLAPTLAVGVAGSERGTVQPGLSLGVHW